MNDARKGLCTVNVLIGALYCREMSKVLMEALTKEKSLR